MEIYIFHLIVKQQIIFLLYIELNRNKVKEIMDKIYTACKKEMIFEEILKYIFDEYNLTIIAY